MEKELPLRKALTEIATIYRNTNLECDLATTLWEIHKIADSALRLQPVSGLEKKSMNSIMDDNVTMFNGGIPLWDKHAVNKCCREWEAQVNRLTPLPSNSGG